MTTALWTIVTGNHTATGAAATAPAAWATALDVVDQLVDQGAVDLVTVTVAGEPVLISPAVGDNGTPMPEETHKAVEEVRAILASG
jgi:hypothetical protein